MSKRKKRKLRLRKKPTAMVTIDSEENDDWMKSLPGYADEVKIHKELGKEYAAKD